MFEQLTVCDQFDFAHDYSPKLICYTFRMSVLILNGPTGTGKNTIAEILSKKRGRCVVIDVDLLRLMVKNPHKAPWQDEEGKHQQLLGGSNACLLTKEFIKNDFSVIILDVLSYETAKFYKDNLNEFEPKLVLLLPTWEEIVRRNKTRERRLTDEELKMVYQQQTELKTYDKKIDNTKLSAEEVAEKLVEYMNDEGTEHNGS